MPIGIITSGRSHFRSSPPVMFLGKHVLKICSKFTGEHPCLCEISIKILFHAIWIYIVLFYLIWKPLGSLVNTFQPSGTFHTETSHLIYCKVVWYLYELQLWAEIDLIGPTKSVATWFFLSTSITPCMPLPFFYSCCSPPFFFSFHTLLRFFIQFSTPYPPPPPWQSIHHPLHHHIEDIHFQQPTRTIWILMKQTKQILRLRG